MITDPHRYYSQALRDAGIVEVRHIDGHCVRSGLFDNLAALEEAISECGKSGNTYTTLNAPTTVVASNAMDGRALRDEDIQSVMRLPFDFDPVRPTGTNASDAELALAVQRRDEFVRMLAFCGWPLPLTAMSGNGAHALYRCRLRATPELRSHMRLLYSQWAIDYSSETVKFDTTVSNPSRIFRAYGSLNRKGPAQPDRPQRIATCRIPERWQPVSPKALDAAVAACSARQVPVRPKPMMVPRGRSVVGSGDYKTLDAVAWFTAHGHFKRRIDADRMAVVCPWRHEHSDPEAGLDARGSDTVVFLRDGNSWPAFTCAHNHCAGRNMATVMALWGDADNYCGRVFQRGATP